VAFPKKVNKKLAQEQWRKINPSEGLRAEILAAIERQRLGAQWLAGFIPDLHRWLRDRRWEDEVDSARPAASNGAPAMVDRHAPDAWGDWAKPGHGGRP
jgi:hypothetical protein